MDIALIGDLLHDAQLIDLTWDQQACCVRMTCECLRKNTDGSELADTAVDLIFADVRAVAIFWQPASHEVRPSQCPRFADATIEGVREVFAGAGTLGLSVCEQPYQYELETACGVRWVAGDSNAAESGDCRFAVDAWCDPGSYGPKDILVRLAIFCDRIDIEADSVPLALEQWHDQFAAFWDDWKEYWDEQDGDSEEDEDGDEPVPEDAAIPAGQQCIV